MQCVVSGNEDGGYSAAVVEISASGTVQFSDETPLPADRLAQWVADFEAEHSRFQLLDALSGEGKRLPDNWPAH